MKNCEIWNIESLIERQRSLDYRINEENNTNYVETFLERQLALMVELNELINETRCFKYWSKKTSIDNERILDEYVDGIHFIFSLMIYYEIDDQAMFEIECLKKASKKELTEKFIFLNQTLFYLNEKEKFNEWIVEYFKLAYQLGFDFEDVFLGYEKKWLINNQRQDQGY